jgi:hypothetical protein
VCGVWGGVFFGCFCLLFCVFCVVLYQHRCGHSVFDVFGVVLCLEIFFIDLCLIFFFFVFRDLTDSIPFGNRKIENIYTTKIKHQKVHKLVTPLAP